jgi:hypothetical protein
MFVSWLDVLSLGRALYAYMPRHATSRFPKKAAIHQPHSITQKLAYTVTS